jgi:hypothetical protein
VGCAIKEKVCTSHLRDGCRLMPSNRALDRARAIELDFTDGGKEEDTMCPVCRESTRAPSCPILVPR